MTRHAVFATSHDLRRARVSNWLGWNTAQDEWERLDDLRRAGELPDVKFLEVRSMDDPNYRSAPHEPWMSYTADEKPKWVKLDRAERAALLELGRKQSCLDEASDVMFDALFSDPRWEHLPAVDVSDYAHAAARFCFPHEARYW